MRPICLERNLQIPEEACDDIATTCDNPRHLDASNKQGRLRAIGLWNATEQFAHTQTQSTYQVGAGDGVAQGRNVEDGSVPTCRQLDPLKSQDIDCQARVDGLYRRPTGRDIAELVKEDRGLLLTGLVARRHTLLVGQITPLLQEKVMTRQLAMARRHWIAMPFLVAERFNTICAITAVTGRLEAS